MTEQKFSKLVREFVADYINKTFDSSRKVTEEDVYIVWSCKTLQNNKALASTNLMDGMYYELTYNGNKDEIYLDAYRKVENIRIELQGK